MRKQTKKQSRRARRRTIRRLPKGKKRGGANTFPLLPTNSAISVTTPESSDNVIAFSGK
jgi:hypothetical protein